MSVSTKRIPVVLLLLVLSYAATLGSLATASQCISTDVDAKCSATQVCANGLCCSSAGYCGSTSDYCGTGCQSQCDLKAISGLSKCGSSAVTTSAKSVAAVTTKATATPTPKSIAIATTPDNFPSALSDARTWNPSTKLVGGTFTRDQYGTYQSCGWNGMFAYTLDDGPHPKYSDMNLKIAADHGVKMTHFWVGQMVSWNPEVSARIIAGGHQIGSHTYTHADLTTLSMPQIKVELDRTEDVITPLLGNCLRPRVFRPPYGNMNKDIYTYITNNYGYKIVTWSIDSLDWKSDSSLSAIKNTYTGLMGSPTATSHISLNHDILDMTNQVMSPVLDMVKQKSFTHVPMYICLNDMAYQKY